MLKLIRAYVHINAEKYKWCEHHFEASYDRNHLNQPISQPSIHRAQSRIFYVVAIMCVCVILYVPIYCVYTCVYKMIVTCKQFILVWWWAFDDFQLTLSHANHEREIIILLNTWHCLIHRNRRANFCTHTKHWHNYSSTIYVENGKWHALLYIYIYIHKVSVVVDTSVIRIVWIVVVAMVVNIKILLYSFFYSYIFNMESWWLKLSKKKRCLECVKTRHMRIT